MTELYKKHRPRTLEEVVGQPEAVGMLTKLSQNGGIPHAILFSGPSGCGKTTLARILKRMLDCRKHDFFEIDAATNRGIDTIREISQTVDLAPMSGGSRIWLLDECHAYLGPSQNALLKLLEDTPEHAYFFLATTDPGKLLKTIVTRCTEIKLRSLTPRELTKVINDVLEKEGRKDIGDAVIEKIPEMADGSARKALVILHQVLNLSDDKARMEAIQKADVQKKAIDLCRALFNPRSQWKEVADLIKAIDDDPEDIRRAVLGYASAVALNQPKPGRAYEVLLEFREPFYNTGKPGLVLACLEVFRSGGA